MDSVSTCSTSTMRGLLYGEEGKLQPHSEGSIHSKGSDVSKHPADAIDKPTVSPSWPISLLMLWITRNGITINGNCACWRARGVLKLADTGPDKPLAFQLVIEGFIIHMLDPFQGSILMWLWQRL